MDEIQSLIQCHYDNENPNVRRAFILCLYCGLRFCDVKDLAYKNIDYTNHLLKFEQNKTKGHSTNSGVVIPLNDGLLSLIGEAPEDLDTSIFNLPTYESCCKSVKRWVKRAGINKHISWHCARHSFAVNILLNSAAFFLVRRFYVLRCLFWALYAVMRIFGASWVLPGHEIPHPNQWGSMKSHKEMM